MQGATVRITKQWWNNDQADSSELINNWHLKCWFHNLLCVAPFPSQLVKIPIPLPTRSRLSSSFFLSRAVAPVPISHGSETGIRFHLLCATPGTCNWAQRQELNKTKKPGRKAKDKGKDTFFYFMVSWKRLWENCLKWFVHVCSLLVHIETVCKCKI